MAAAAGSSRNEMLSKPATVAASRRISTACSEPFSPIELRKCTGRPMTAVRTASPSCRMAAMRMCSRMCVAMCTITLRTWGSSRYPSIDLGDSMRFPSPYSRYASTASSPNSACWKLSTVAVGDSAARCSIHWRRTVRRATRLRAVASSSGERAAHGTQRIATQLVVAAFREAATALLRFRRELALLRACGADVCFHLRVQLRGQLEVVRIGHDLGKEYGGAELFRVTEVDQGQVVADEGGRGGVARTEVDTDVHGASRKTKNGRAIRCLCSGRHRVNRGLAVFRQSDAALKRIRTSSSALTMADCTLALRRLSGTATAMEATGRPAAFTSAMATEPTPSSLSS